MHLRTRLLPLVALGLVGFQVTTAFSAAPVIKKASSSARSVVRVKKSSSAKALLQKAKSSVAQKGAYLDFVPAVIGNGKTSVLFFKASWCGMCKSADADLRKLYNENPQALTIYRVDYDTYPDLRKKYRVSYQHTFVKIDGQGNFVTAMIRPDLDKLKAFLSN